MSSEWQILPERVENLSLREEEKVKAKNRDWPWRADHVSNRVITQAPFALNQYSYNKLFKYPRKKQTSGIFTLGCDLESNLIRILFQSGHFTAANFGATCQEAFHNVSMWVAHWDTSRGEFCDCEQSPKSELASVPGVVVVSPFRYRGSTFDTHEQQMVNLHKLTTSFRNFSDNFVTLHLHRVGLLTVELLALAVPYMRKLKHLGVYRCELIHVGHVKPILEIISSNRSAWMTQDVNLDIYPRFHIGPEPDKNPALCTGSYGVTWDNFGGLDTRVAIWAIMAKIILKAQEIEKARGSDGLLSGLLDPGSALRHWLDLSPCWEVQTSLEHIIEKHPKDYSRESAAKVASLVNWGDKKLRKENFLSTHSAQHIGVYECRGCGPYVLGTLFPWDEYLEWISRRMDYQMTCLGCQLISYMNNERDHYKYRKNIIAQAWLTADHGQPGAHIITEDLELALTPQQLNPALVLARLLDRKYLRYLTRNRKTTSGPFSKRAGDYIPGVDYEGQRSMPAGARFSPCIIRDRKDHYPSQQW